MDLDFQSMRETATAALTTFGLKALGALAAWIVGRYLIGLTVRLVTAALGREEHMHMRQAAAAQR